ncbi:hypothetical protein DEO72_LG6g672 [Vigna unguiculata]|uniref:Uncharacterized protein n=1 Tax=Vigna unguiculata TaxID=3917 RepID=A0A4D6M7W8_VIGUN|nr:hypothetical protein DEO72_LG6g672 [Vigna unguiculata]
MVTSQENENNSAKRYSFKNWFQTSMTLVHPQWEFVEFDETFFAYWGQHMLMGPIYFRDLVGNFIMVEFEDSLMENRKFRIASELAKFYKLDDLYWLVIIYYGNRYFQFRIFSLPMEEIYYPAPNMVPMPQHTLSSSRFMTCFRFEILVSEKIIRLDDSFVIFWGHELTINKFKLIDPRQKKHDVSIQKLENGDFIIHKAIEIDYTAQLVSSNNSEALSSNDGGYDPTDFYHSMSKCLSSNDAKSSSLVTDS